MSKTMSKTIHEWFWNFEESGCLYDNLNETSRQGPSVERVNCVLDAFVQYLRKVNS